PGGLLRTEELTLPGFKHDVYSAAHPLFLTGPAYADLRYDLATHGLKYVNTEWPTGVSLAGGRTAVCSRSIDANIEEFERLAPGDGEAFADIVGELQPYADDLYTLFNRELASVDARRTIATLMNDGRFAALVFQNPCVVLDRFSSPEAKAMLAPWTMRLGRTPVESGGGFCVPLVVFALMSAGMPIPVGGSERLADALVGLVRQHGGEIRTACEATSIVVRGGRATAVRTADGALIPVKRAVVASVNPDQLYLKLLADASVDALTHRHASNYRYGRGCVQISVALSEPPRWRDERFKFVGQPHLSSGSSEGALACAHSMLGLLPISPSFTVDCPTDRDPSRAPAGKAILRIQVLEVPTHPVGDAGCSICVAGEWTDSVKNAFADRVLGIVGQHISNIPDAIIGVHVVSPRELAGFSPNLGPGDPYGGAHGLAQSYLLRPLPEYPSHQSVISNIHMLGAGTWPGHGINGRSGYVVAQSLLAQAESDSR
ncbi:MAG TPA: NAD(P)/FAD-dependent oxidoreductase, partial [Gemmatimonadaceae bacterium]